MTVTGSEGSGAGEGCSERHGLSQHGRSGPGRGRARPDAWPSGCVRPCPGSRRLASYQPAWLPKDVVAGLVLASLLVPQGMAYAELAGLPAITGLYTSILCLLAYALFGPSRILVLGPDSSLGPMIAATVLPLVAADGDPGKAVAYASVLALMVGALMLVGARVGLGFIADLLSKPTQIGYMNGLALTILVSQLPKLFGFSVDADGLIEEIVALRRRRSSRARPTRGPWASGCSALVVMLVLGRWLPKVPAVLVGVLARDGGRGRLRARRSRGAARRRAAERPAAVQPSARPSSRTCRCSRSAPSASRSSRSRTRSRPRRPSPPAPGRRSARTRRWWASARPTSRPGCSAGSRSARAARGRPSRSGPGRSPSSRASWAPPSSP